MLRNPTSPEAEEDGYNGCFVQKAPAAIAHTNPFWAFLSSNSTWPNGFNGQEYGYPAVTEWPASDKPASLLPNTVSAATTEEAI
jgi:hypothetical protein